MKPVTSGKAGPLSGTVAIPGDKSISHRALMFGALAIGETRIEGLLEGEDVLSTAQALRDLGVSVERLGQGTWRVIGRGVGGLREPGGVLDMGNAGTAARLMMGILAGHGFTSFMTGDASLCSRPMERVMKPLRNSGAQFLSRSGGRLPLAITGRDVPLPQEYELPVASAQVKSAVLLAGLHAPGVTRVVEPTPSRDHTELMLRHFGADISVEETENGGRIITLVGQPELRAANVVAPGDPSSAAFPVVAALIVPGSEITVTNVGMNPLRTGLFDSLREMGARIEITNRRDQAGEPVADLVVKASCLHGATIPASRAPSMIDEYPVLAMAAACATGMTRMEGIGELRVKESDRLDAVAKGLAACGVTVEEGEDWLVVHGMGTPMGGGNIAARLDHRLAMSFLVLGMAANQPVHVDDASPMDTSFPGFADLMNGLGANLTVEAS